VLVDLAGDRAALTTIRLVRARHPDVPIVGIIEPANPVAAAEALQAGVIDLLPWPFELADLAALVAHHCDRASGSSPAKPSTRDPGFDWFLGSTAMRPVREAIEVAASARHGIAVCGDPGVGHQAVARAIHAFSGGAPDTFVPVTCRQSPDDLERQLFGNTDRRDLVSSATADRLSETCAIRRSSGGTLFIDHIVHAPARVQARLARLARDREALDDGGSAVSVDMRLVVALEGAVASAVDDGRLRHELADRLVTHVDIPPLIRRQEDIPRLAARLLKEACERHGLPMRHFSRSALTLLGALPWPRNLDDLSAVADSAACSARGLVVHIEDVLAHARLDTLAPRVDAVMTLREARRRFERECITAALVRHHGRVGDAAKTLGIQRTNLYRKVRQLNVERALLTPRRS
jgi:DNA-binding NtrC family response regulator